MTEYEIACKDKRRYSRRKYAKHDANSIRRTGGPALRPYECPFCASWHLGHRLGHATYLRKDRLSPTGSSPLKESA